MPSNIPPTRDDEALDWCRNFARVVREDAGAVGLTVAQSEAFDALTEAYAAALQLAVRPETRTTPVVVAKTDAKRLLLSEARKLGAICRAHLIPSDPLRAALGLHVRSAGSPARGPRPAPTTMPLLRVVRAGGGEATVTLRDSASPDRRAKPRFVLGALLSVAVTKFGARPPAGFDEGAAPTAFHALVTDTTYRLTLPPGSEGRAVWVRARWVNERGIAGPAGPAASALVVG